MPFISSFDARRSFPTAGTGTTSNYTSSSSSSSSNPRGFDRFSSSRKSTVFERPSAYTPSSSTSSFTYSSSRPSTLERLDRYTVQMIFIKSKTKIKIFYYCKIILYFIQRLVQIFYRLKNADSSSGYSSGAGLSSSPSAASSYLSVPTSSRFSSGTSSPLFLNDRSRNNGDNTNNNSTSNNHNGTNSYSTLSPSGTVSPNTTSSSRYEMSATVPNYHR